MALSRLTTVACSAALLMFGAAAQAAGNTGEVRSNFQQERASCAHVPEASRAPCLREAGAAAQAARNGQLTSPGDSTYQQNAMARCEVFKTQEGKADCQARMRNRAASGSVEGGGVLREATTLVPASR
ncbi:hypothetical protein [Pulveribacter sp.]|uniref:hypothetical protein n=1 Tax=Pulveribacter sp. TaxID=2678893 RepID=UPI0028B1D655|nr:hypothetical protein [Pulveribacter sp.]